ncbi:MAG: HAMP domain-containing sensor histidine kinase [Acidobacteriota bacterium]
MTRIRIVFVLLALVLLVSLGLVVDRALDSVAAERSMRHRALADRIVDEMEGELTAWLRQEEDRPFAQYRYFFVPEGSPTQIVNLTRSPLSELPSEPFVVCYFQIDPDGTVSSPLWPDNEGLASAAAGWSSSNDIRSMVELVRQSVGDFWAVEVASGRVEALTAPVAGERREADRVKDLEAQLAKQLKPVPKGKAAKKDAPPEAKTESSLSVLSRLNRGASARKERPTKVAPSQAANVYNFQENESNMLQQAVQSQVEVAAFDDDQTERAADLRQRLSEPPATTRAIEEGIAESLDVESSATIDVRLQPMVGRRATDQHLALYRTVSIGAQAYQQGLMLDLDALVDWAAERVLADGDLAARARVTRKRPSSASRTYTRGAPSLDRGAIEYRYDFADPFGEVQAFVTLDPLSEDLGPVNLYTLSLLLAFASTFGLFALYRMVAVVVSYAERRNNFVSAVTHELKTPLTAIRMYGEMLRDGVVPEEGKRQQYYEIMTAETERLTRLVQNVLELSQLEQKKRSMTMVVGDVVPIMQEVIELLGPHAEKQGFAFELRTEPDLPQVRFDRDALIQVLFNLVDNALKYSATADDKRIVLSCRSEGEGVVLAVVDQGPGVARRQLGKIFEPFYRAENELTRTSKGTGIGLALVSGLVERMGGTVSGRNRRRGGFEVEVALSAA